MQQQPKTFLTIENLDILLDSLSESQKSTRHPTLHITLEEVLTGFLKVDNIQHLEMMWNIPCTNGVTSRFIKETTGWDIDKDGVAWSRKLTKCAQVLQDQKRKTENSSALTKKLLRAEKKGKEKQLKKVTNSNLTVSIADLEKFGIIHPDREERFNILKELLSGVYDDQLKI